MNKSRGEGMSPQEWVEEGYSFFSVRGLSIQQACVCFKTGMSRDKWFLMEMHDVETNKNWVLTLQNGPINAFDKDFLNK